MNYTNATILSTAPTVESMFSLRGKTAVVTGCAGLLGREHCRALAIAGADVIATDVDADACRQTVTQLCNELGDDVGSRLVGMAVDVADQRSVERLRDEIMLCFGSIDILVNNAAVNDMFERPENGVALSRYENYPLDCWRRSLEVNVTGVHLCSQILGSEMARRGGGSIINVASTYALVGPDQSIYRRPDGTQDFYKSAAYPTTKGAVVSFTRFLAAWWGSAGVRVNALVPGGVENGQDDDFIANYADRTLLGRMARIDDYHGALIFLAGDASRYMTGSLLVVDGGWTAI